ncbi:hypothetical protein CWC22_012115 [Pseudoalteromonas rubra]|uniref:Low-complexity protein n=1 Tax=Pseudoalteromonas rubra TaxID=43658 RepID=A0A5S3UQG8_9GAMM|nr:hypothetical protein [Pseudoalteromonas rubra]QPB83696.1 hypothetical protein CWC22_012115 [Pseudoalteromonas rubra]
MKSVKKTNTLAMTLGAAVVTAATFSAPEAAANPFSFEQMTAGYQLDAGEGKCGEGKCGGDAKGKKEGKCGEGKCGGDAKGKKEGKCGEGKCGGKTKKEGKCGEGKCGGHA